MSCGSEAGFPPSLLTCKQRSTITGSISSRVNAEWFPLTGIAWRLIVKKLTVELRKFDPDFQSWMIAVSYEVEERPARPGAALSRPWHSWKGLINPFSWRISLFLQHL